MVNKKMVPSIIAVIAVTLAVTISIQPIIQTVYAAWYTVNTDPQLYDSSKWGIGLWHQSTSYVHNYYINGGQAYTHFKTGGFNKWGNTQYGQGHDIWSTWGAALPYEPSAATPMRFRTYSKTLLENNNWLYGVANQYVELWLEHTGTGDGSKGYKYAELMVILDSSRNELIPPYQNTYLATTRVEPDSQWYFVIYRHWNMGTNWVYRETNLNWILNQLNTQWGCNLSQWKVTGITFGVECTSGEMIALWDYVFWDIGM